MSISIEKNSAVGRARRKMQRPTKEPLRPWMLGTNDIPPPMDVPWQMWSQSSSPYEQGLIQFEFTPKGLAVRWFGVDEKRYVIEWHELGIIANLPPKLEEDLQHLKEKSEHEGYLWGLAKALERYGDKTQMPPEKPNIVIQG